MVECVNNMDSYLKLYKGRLNLANENKSFVYCSDYYKKKGIYFLVKNEVVVYVGMSNYSIHHRVDCHQNRKKFDSVFFIDLKNSDSLRVAEYVYINIFNPKYNKIDKNFEYSDYINDFNNL